MHYTDGEHMVAVAEHIHTENNRQEPERVTLEEVLHHIELVEQTLAKLPKDSVEVELFTGVLKNLKDQKKAILTERGKGSLLRFMKNL